MSRPGDGNGSGTARRGEGAPPAAHSASPATVGAEGGTERTGDDTDRNFVAALARGLMVIQAFTNQGREMSISQISYKTGITRAAVRRYLHTLVELGFANCHAGARYSLTAKTVSLGNAYLSGKTLSGRSQPVLDKLSETVGEACSMAVRDGTDIVYITRATSSRIMSSSLNVGSRLPAYATSIGLVLLAYLDEADLADYLAEVKFLPFTPHTIVTAGALRAELAVIRANGYALADQMIEVGLRSIAVPVFDRDGNVESGINIIANSSRVSAEQMRTRFLPLLLDAARVLQS